MSRLSLSVVASLFVVMATVELTQLPAVCAEWQEWRLLNWGCVSDEDAVACDRVGSRIECLAKASRMRGFNVAQWRVLTGVCCIFHYQQVCRLQSASASECQVFARLSQLLQFVRSLAQKLRGVWVFGDSRECDLQNLWRRVTRNRIQSINITWSSEGATFNGENSYMMLNDTDLMDYRAGLTWLMRLRRSARVQPFFNLMLLDDLDTLAAQLHEYPLATQLYFNSQRGSSPNLIATAVSGTLPDSADAWVNVGVTGDSDANSVNLFVGDAFLPVGGFTRVTKVGLPATPVALLIGHRMGSSRWLQGTVSTVAVANESMTEDEIRRFFSLLP